MAGIKAEIGKITELETLGTGLGSETLQQFARRNLMRGLPHANAAFIKVLQSGEQFRGNVLSAKHLNKRGLFLGGLRFIQVFFHLLDHKKTGDLRPSHLGEEAFKVRLEDRFGFLREVVHERHELAAPLLEAFPIRDQFAGLRRQGPGGRLVKLGVKSLEEARDIRRCAEYFFQGFVVGLIQRGFFDPKSFDLTAGFHEVILGAGEFPLLRKLITKFQIAFLVRKKAQIIRVEFLRSAFHENRLKTIFFIHVAQKLFDLHLGLVIGMGVLNVKNELRIRS